MFRLLTILLFATTLLVACGGSSTGSPASPTTTVMVYIIGANLESEDGQASANIKEMMAVGSTANMTVVIQTGGAKKDPGSEADTAKDPTRAIDWRRVQRYQVQKGTLSKLDDLGPDAKGTNVDMGSKATLQSFLAWGVKAYPADKYIVVLWDHGGGINSGIGSDEITGNALSVPAIQESLQTVSQAQNIKFEMVGFDACLMANAEVAASLANSTKYMVASQDLEPGGGWAWNGFLKFVTDNPAATGKDIGAEIANSYLVKMNLAKQTVTLSVTDLSKMAALSAATDGFATALQKYTVNAPASLIAWKQIAFARARSLDWQTAPILAMSTDLVDMASFPANVVTNINKYVGADQPLMDASDALYNALGAAVVYKIQNGSNLPASGLALYFPSTLAAYVDGYHAYASNTMFSGIATFASKYTNGSTGLVKNYYDFYATNKDQLEAQVTMDSTKGKYAAVISNDFALVLSAHQADACQIYYDANKPPQEVPCFDAIQENVNTATDSTGQWGVDFIGTRSWASIEGSAYTVAMIPDQVATVGSNINNRSLVPVYRWNTTYSYWEDGALSVEEYVPEGGSTTALRVLGFQGAPGSSSNADRIAPIKDGDQFALGAYYRGKYSDGTPADYYVFGRTNRQVTVSGGALNLKRGPIPSGGSFGYIVTDLTGKLSVSSTVGYQN
ncbi:MAG: clostripain-related cysteine peptidase [Rhodoferax sp.]|uniref:clostripain-related cysteine peptidase n=1 Tax=Rhodoferax sp. TaxID=50421 RepID=UPI00262F2CDD|nr:clostripain-related cysteine peptidase [Rhodoferax sp.]MDD5334063.1 clostripain-related cysteine peptidase [Rhodoferax sp.]